MDVDITGWSEDEIQAWENAHEQFATDERANEAADAWERENVTPQVIAESEAEAVRQNLENERDDGLD